MEMERLPEQRLVEELAANAWAPYTSQALGAWRLRATFGVSMRANSVWTIGETPEEGWLGEAELFYRRRGLPVSFHISEATPIGVDDALAEAGYEKMYPCLYLTVSAAEVLLHGGTNTSSGGGSGSGTSSGSSGSGTDTGTDADHDPGTFRLLLADDADDDWIGDFLRAEGFDPARAAAYRHIFRAIGPVKTFARLTDGDGASMAFATAVAERGWCGLSNIIVDPACRRRGAAVRLIRGLAAWAAGQGADRLWLQVLESNDSAMRLYDKLGFAPLMRYHYRVKRL